MNKLGDSLKLKRNNEDGEMGWVIQDEQNRLQLDENNNTVKNSSIIGRAEFAYITDYKLAKVSAPILLNHKINNNYTRNSIENNNNDTTIQNDVDRSIERLSERESPNNNHQSDYQKYGNESIAEQDLENSNWGHKAPQDFNFYSFKNHQFKQDENKKSLNYSQKEKESSIHKINNDYFENLK